MSKELIVRGSFIIALLLLCLVAGIIGGLDFAPDVMLIVIFRPFAPTGPG